MSEPVPPVAAGRAPLRGRRRRRGGRTPVRRRRARALVGSLRESELTKAAGLAAAMIVSNVVGLAFTVVFARVLGVGRYGALAALVSTFLILSVPGAALQVAAARQGALGRLGEHGDLAATVQRWTRTLILGTAVLTALAVLLRHPIAAAIGVREEWGAAATVTTGCLWLLLSIERGVLQGIRAYGVVGVSMVLEQVGRLAFSGLLVAGGLGVTGAYLGSPVAMLALALALGAVLRRRLGHAPSGAPLHRLRELAAGAWAPIIGLLFVAVLQNIDVIAAHQRLPSKAAGAYATAAVAAKVVIWIAIGVGFYLVPETARRSSAGEDPRGGLARALGLIGLAAVPCLAIFILAPRLLLHLAFGPDSLPAADSLVVLGAAMTLVAALYLAVQYLLALHRMRFLGVLVAFAATEVVLLFWVVDVRTIASFARVVLAIQVVAAAVLLALCLRRGPGPAPAVAGVGTARPPTEALPGRERRL